jgi:hypothetical protein
VTTSASVPHGTTVIRRTSWIAMLTLSSLLAVGTARAGADAASEAKAFLHAFSERAIAMLADDRLARRGRLGSSAIWPMRASCG